MIVGLQPEGLGVLTSRLLKQPVGFLSCLRLGPAGERNAPVVQRGRPRFRILGENSVQLRQLWNTFAVGLQASLPHQSEQCDAQLRNLSSNSQGASDGSGQI